jgi:sugar lactone lactonase YvrE
MSRKSFAFGSLLEPLLLSGVVFCLGACAPASDPQPAAESDTAIPAVGGEDASVPLWTATEGMDTPESVYVDEASGSIFVSQVVGEPAATDGAGHISRLDMEGNVTDPVWVDGLNAPKGIRSHEGVLWTSDIDRLIGIDIGSAEIVAEIAIEGAMFLNDVAVDESGTIYVSDMMASRIYAVRDQNAEVFAEGPDIEYPNGLLVDGGRLVVAAWGEPNEDFTTDVPGRLFALDLATREKTLITEDPLGNLDGLESDGRGGFIVSDYLAGRLIQVTAGGEIVEIGQFAPGAADLAFLPATNTVLVPHMNENQVSAYDLSDVLE